MNLDRRSFIGKYARFSALFTIGGLILENCKPKNETLKEKERTDRVDPCQDLIDISAEEIQKRENLAYVNESPIADNQCNNCNLYLPPNGRACGGCMLFKGPVEAKGYCTYWAPKVG